MDHTDLNAFHPGGQAQGFPEHTVPLLEAGQFYEGQCSLPFPHKNLVEVRLRGFDRVEPCIWIAGFFSGLMGLNSTFTPLEGTRVLVFYTGRDFSYIVGAWPDTRTVTEKRSTVGGDSVANLPLFQATQSRTSELSALTEHQPPVDLLPGELDLTNLHGVGLTLLRHMASLQAGDLARIECHLLDDMVRIISQNFRHHTALGDHSITNDHGRLNAVWHATSREHETWGKLRPSDKKMEVEGETGVAEPTAGTTDEGRWRFSQFVGWLGDFVHIFVTDPVNQLGKLAESAVRAGRFRCHVNSDGSLLVQSVADIVFEKVVAIPVPIQLRREDDPSGDQVPDEDKLIPSPVDNDWKPSSAQAPFEMAFQLREYARWLNNQLSFARFRQMPKDWKVPTERATVDAVPSDPAQHVRWIQSYACIRIYRDGSIQNLDAYGNAITLSANGVQVSSTRDLLLQAAGSVNIIAGRDVNIRGRRHVNASADTGSFRIKGSEAIKLMSSVGPIVLETSEAASIYLLSNLRVGTGFELTRAGNLKCAGEVNVIDLMASGDVSAKYLTHGTLMLAGEGPHSNHVGFGGGGVAPEIAAIPNGTAFAFQANDTYGPTVQYETISQSMLASGDVESNGVWDLRADDADRGKPWPGATMTYKFTPAGVSLSDPSAASNFTNRPAGMQGQSSGSASIRYKL